MLKAKVQPSTLSPQRLTCDPQGWKWIPLASPTPLGSVHAAAEAVGTRVVGVWGGAPGSSGARWGGGGLPGQLGYLLGALSNGAD